jgi:hypothetical protein
VAEAAHKVVQEGKNAGVWVFGGVVSQRASVVTTDGTVTDGPFPETNAVIGGFSVVDVPSRVEALAWAAKIAVACRCAQEVRELCPTRTSDRRPTAASSCHRPQPRGQSDQSASSIRPAGPARIGARQGSADQATTGQSGRRNGRPTHVVPLVRAGARFENDKLIERPRRPTRPRVRRSRPRRMARRSTRLDASFCAASRAGRVMTTTLVSAVGDSRGR